MTRQERLIIIRDKARELFFHSNLHSCEALSRLVEWTLDEFSDVYLGRGNDDEEQFVDDLGMILTDRSEYVLWARDEDGLWVRDKGDSCFQAQFQDNGGDQVRHFWGYVMMSFNYGRILATNAVLRELFPPEKADALLGYRGIELGAALTWNVHDLSEVADWIRRWVCSNDCPSFTSVSGEEGED